MKIDEIIKCPHCGETNNYKFYIDADSLICGNEECDKIFDINVKTEVVVTPSIPKRKCRDCNGIFIGEEFSYQEETCPYCMSNGIHIVY